MTKKITTETLRRTRDSNYSIEERLQVLRDMRDDALDWAAGLISDRVSKGTSAALHAFEQASLHIQSLESTSNAQTIDLSIAGFEPDKIEMPQAEKVQA